MTTVTINDKIVCPLYESWNEIPSHLLVAIAPTLLQKEISLADRSYIAATLLGFGTKDLRKPLRKAKPGDWDYLSTQVLALVLPRYDFLFEDIQLTDQPQAALVVPSRMRLLGSKVFYGPASDFNNLTLAEFSDLEYCINQYDSTGEELWLNRFMAILYRPRNEQHTRRSANFSGDVRQPYNIHLNDEYAELLRRIPAGCKAAAVLWYYGCRNAITEANKNLFSKDNQDKANGASWTDVIHELSGPKFGSIEQTGKTLLKVILRELQLIHQRQMELA